MNARAAKIPSTRISRRARLLINRLDRRAQDYAFLGGLHPVDQGTVEQTYHDAHAAIARYIEELEQVVDELERELRQ